MFLPDRFVKGTCPKCKAEDQYGDNCEVCSATYSPTELINPRSVVSGATPVLRESEHYFFDLPAFADMLQAWTRSGALRSRSPTKCRSGLIPACSSGISAVMRRISALRSLMHRANTSMSGWMRQSATWGHSKPV